MAEGPDLFVLVQCVVMWRTADAMRSSSRTPQLRGAINATLGHHASTRVKAMQKFTTASNILVGLVIRLPSVPNHTL
ncbi:MAG: hypothetical protein P1S60_12515 [Anaerolineae bacterium]|nr:hypothetical protein [Anaerolineae bacterium]